MPKASNTARHLAPLCAVQLLSVFKNTLFSAFLVLYLATFCDSVFSVSWMLLVFAVAAALPNLILLLPAGLLADRIPKRYVLILTAFLDLLICGGTFLCGFGRDSLVFVALLFMTRAFYSPAFYGILPELFHEEDLSGANGSVCIRSFAGLLTGLGAAWLIQSPAVICSICTICAAAAFLLTFRIRFTVSAGVQYSAVHEFFAGLRDLTKRPSVLVAGLGENFFLAIGTLLPFLILLCQYEIKAGITTPFTSGILLILPVAGFALGTWLAGRLSVQKIEPGLVPFGALGVALSLFLGSRFFGPLISFNVAMPYFSGTVVIPAGATLFLLLGGISGGLFVLPLRTYLQQRLRRGTRGMSLAMHNAVFFGLSGLLTWLLFYFQSGTLAEILPESVRFGERNIFSAVTLLTSLGWITFLVTLFSMWALPEFALRFLIISLGNTVYKLKITGAEHIPQHGPALLVANHVSFIDNILVSACTSRKIRFLMQEELIRRYSSLRLLARLTRFITVPASGKGLLKMVEDVRDALRAGEIICVYPEGTPTRNSITGRFRGGFLKMLPPEMPDIPVIPVHIGGMWGSRFSYYRAIADFQLPLRTSNRAAVSFGAPVKREDQTAFAIRQKIGELSADTMTESTRPEECPLHTRLFRNMKRHPFRPLFRDSDGSAVTVSQAFLSSLLASRKLRKKLAANEIYLGILLPNSSHAAVTMLASLYADRVPCPLNHTTPKDVLTATIRQSGIRHIITSRAFLEKLGYEPEGASVIYLEELIPELPVWKTVLLLPVLMALPVRELMNLVSPLSREDVYRPATILFSSGSTGVPKGVILSHHNMNSDMHALIDLLGFKPEIDGILGNLPLFHSFGMTTCFWIPAATACPVSYIPSPLDAALAGTVIARDRLTILYATPSFLQLYLRKCTKEQFASLRLVVTGAEKLRADIAARLKEFTDGRLSVTEAYGCTELSPVVTVNIPEDQKKLGQEAGKTDSIGPGIEYTAAKVVDPITFEELPPGSEGLLFVKGPMVMQGYLNAPDLTKKSIIDGYYNTGDIVTMDQSGYISICGRLSRFSKIAGEMIPHEMVERIINELCGTNSRVVAVGSIPDPQKGEALLVLYTPDMPFTPAEIVEQLRERSISNLWIPKAVNFHPVDNLPLLGSGKLDLSTLRTIADRIAAEQNCQNKGAGA